MVDAVRLRDQAIAQAMAGNVGSVTDETLSAPTVSDEVLDDGSDQRDG